MQSIGNLEQYIYKIVRAAWACFSDYVVGQTIPIQYSLKKGAHLEWWRLDKFCVWPYSNDNLTVTLQLVHLFNCSIVTCGSVYLIPQTTKFTVEHRDSESFKLLNAAWTCLQELCTPNTGQSQSRVRTTFIKEKPEHPQLSHVSFDPRSCEEVTSAWKEPLILFFYLSYPNPRRKDRYFFSILFFFIFLQIPCLFSFPCQNVACV